MNQIKLSNLYQVKKGWLEYENINGLVFDIIKAIRENRKVELDFSNVNYVKCSFIEDLINGIVNKMIRPYYNFKWYKDDVINNLNLHISFINTNNYLDYVISETYEEIETRLKG